jgi:hypothetical protein
MSERFQLFAALALVAGQPDLSYFMPPNPSLNADVPHAWAAPPQQAAG